MAIQRLAQQPEINRALAWLEAGAERFVEQISEFSQIPAPTFAEERRAEYVSDYDVVVGTHLAKILSGGGEFTSPQRVSEQYLLDLEREAFVSLCGQKKTVERMQYMLKKGKPLRN